MALGKQAFLVDLMAWEGEPWGGEILKVKVRGQVRAGLDGADCGHSVSISVTVSR